jgi:two-component system phosphate regulon response regulator PhoB
VVITLGGNGALYRDGPTVHVPVISAGPVVETTGAGDAFNGGFAVALSEGREVIEAVRFGCGHGGHLGDARGHRARDAVAGRDRGAAGARLSASGFTELSYCGYPTVAESGQKGRAAAGSSGPARRRRGRMMQEAHIRASFDEALEAIQTQLMKLGGLVETALLDAAEALERRDRMLAESVRVGDAAIDTLEEAIQTGCARLLALQSPAAGDLRLVLSIMRIAGALERSGDYAKNLAKRTLVLLEMPLVGNAGGAIRRMAKAVVAMLTEALDAYVARDAARAAEVRRRDEEVDQLYNALFREFLTYMMEDPRNITACMHLHFIAKNIERVGDHATAIAEQVIYLVSGEMPGAARPKVDALARPRGGRSDGRGGQADGPSGRGRTRAARGAVLQPGRRGLSGGAADNGEDALMLVEEEGPDIIILDWMMPRLSGIEVCRRLKMRPETRGIPIIMLSARAEEVDRIRGLETGADDYVIKPYSVLELMARARAQLRRVRPSTVGVVLEWGDIRLDPETHRVYRADKVLKLGPTEFRLLAALIEKPGRVWSREQLLDRVWGRDIYVDTRTVDVHVGRLRKSLMAHGGDDPLRTVRGAGYALG